MISIYKVTANVDHALRISIEAKRETDIMKRKILNAIVAAQYSLMKPKESKSFLKIENKLSMVFDSDYDVKYNTSIKDTCCFFEVDKSDDIVNVLMWSIDDYSLLGFLKIIKNRFDKNEEFIVEKKEDLWTWRHDDYEFSFETEYETYVDILSYLKSVESLIDCLEK